MSKATAIPEWQGSADGLTAASLVAGQGPVVIRRFAEHWPAVEAPDVIDYLRSFDNGTPIDLVVGAPGVDGRFSYAADRTSFNFERRKGALADLLADLVAERDIDRPRSLAGQAISIDDVLPGFGDANRPGIFDRVGPARIWIGNRVVVATHHDMASNVAVVVAGRRRFTLFPPEQAGNLYIGPLEFTPAGTPVSLLDPERPDFDCFPRAREAMATARTAELDPGDAIYIPHMWWHHVRSLDPVSVLVNYWWDEAVAPQPGLAPIDAMVHAMLTFSDLPEEQRAAWRAMFDHFVFGENDGALDAFPPDRHGIRGRLNPELKARLRRQLGGAMVR
jgi:mannose-6-phosphate isomerase-like protein (cupin superfamily)